MYNRSPHSSLGEKTPFFIRHGISENCERLTHFGCTVDRFIEPHKRGKLDNVSSTGIMLGYVENTTEYLVLDFDLCEITKSAYTSNYDSRNFSGIPEEVLKNFILKNNNLLGDEQEKEMKKRPIIQLSLMKWFF